MKFPKIELTIEFTITPYGEQLKKKNRFHEVPKNELRVHKKKKTLCS